MSRRATIILFLLIAQRSLAFRVAESDSLSGADSLRTFAMKEILVTTARLPQVASLSSSPITILDSEEIQKTNATSLAQLLSSVSGMFVKDYGGNSGLKTIAQRGLGPEHTLLLINGMRVSNPQNGLVDLSLISPDGVDRVEVLHGGQSASFGADAVAGVVNIVTGRSNHKTLTASSSIGSFGYREFQLSCGANIESAVVRLAFREERGEEDYPFIFRNGDQRFDLTRRNSDFIARSGTLQSSVSLNSDLALALYARTYDSERGVGGLVAGPASVSVARQEDADHLVQIQLNGIRDEQFRYRAGMQFHQAYQRYHDTSFFIGSSSLDNYFKNREGRAELSGEFAANENSRFSFGGEFAATRGEGNSLNDEVQRSAFGVYAAAMQKLFADASAIDGVLLYPALRVDGISTAGKTISQWSPQFGLAVPFRSFEFLSATPTLRASVSRNLSAPTFNQLFYAGGGGIGNPNLQPERSTSFDVGGDVAFRFVGEQKIQVSYFDIAMSNRIQWVAAGSGIVTPKNIRSVRSNGIELSYRWQLPNDVLTFNANYTLSSTKKTSEDFVGDRNVNTQLVYVPNQTANFSLAASQLIDDHIVKQIGAAFNVAFVGFRYTSEDNKRFLPSYWLAHANVRTKLAIAQVQCAIRFELNNIFNTDYQTMLSYPMPGRSFKISLGVEY